jgi:hypothetical protein
MGIFSQNFLHTILELSLGEFEGVLGMSLGGHDCLKNPLYEEYSMGRSCPHSIDNPELGRRTGLETVLHGGLPQGMVIHTIESLTRSVAIQPDPPVDTHRSEWIDPYQTYANMKLAFCYVGEDEMIPQDALDWLADETQRLDRALIIAGPEQLPAREIDHLVRSITFRSGYYEMEISCVSCIAGRWPRTSRLSERLS